MKNTSQGGRFTLTLMLRKTGPSSCGEPKTIKLKHLVFTMNYRFCLAETQAKMNANFVAIPRLWLWSTTVHQIRPRQTKPEYRCRCLHFDPGKHVSECNFGKTFWFHILFFLGARGWSKELSQVIPEAHSGGWKLSQWKKSRGKILGLRLDASTRPDILSASQFTRNVTLIVSGRNSDDEWTNKGRPCFMILPRSQREFCFGCTKLSFHFAVWWTSATLSSLLSLFTWIPLHDE